MVAGQLLEYKVDKLSGGKSLEIIVGAVYVPSQQIFIAVNAGLPFIGEKMQIGYAIGNSAKEGYRGLVAKVEQTPRFVSKTSVDVRQDIVELIRTRPALNTATPDVLRYLMELVIRMPKTMTTPARVYDGLQTFETTEGPLNIPVGAIYFEGPEVLIKPEAHLKGDKSANLAPTIYAGEIAREELRKMGITNKTPKPPETSVSLEILDWCYQVVGQNNDKLPLEQPAFDELMRLMFPLRYFSDFARVTVENRSRKD